MFKCPFLNQYPDVFALLILSLILAYLIYYGLYCLFLYILALKKRVGMLWVLLLHFLWHSRKLFLIWFCLIVVAYRCSYMHVQESVNIWSADQSIMPISFWSFIFYFNFFVVVVINTKRFLRDWSYLTCVG